MKLTTDYHIYFLHTNTSAMSGGQLVLARNQNPKLHMPDRFDSEAAAMDWVEANKAEVAKLGSFIILPVHLMGK